MLHQLQAASHQVLAGSVLEPNSKYRTAIGVLGMALPLALLAWTAGQGVESSLSAYYYTRGRDWFVGTLWVIGVFLIFYQYRPQVPERATSTLQAVRSGEADAYLGKIAGVSAVLVALLPTTPPAGLTQPPIIGFAHGAAAAAAFVALALFPLVLFSQSSRKARLYQRCGWVMLGCVALIGAHQFSPESARQTLAPLRPVLVLEWTLVWVFAYTWFEKGREPVMRREVSPAISM